METICKIVQDLLPLYKEGLVSEETAEFIEKHIEKCEKCCNESKKINSSSEIDNKEKYSGQSVPLKKVKKKFFKRRLAIIAVAAIVTAALIFFATDIFRTSLIDYGVSQKYSKKEMDAAVDLIEREFYSWEGCKLYSISYAGDEFCENELDYINSLADDGIIFTDCIVFYTNFKTSMFVGGGFNPNFEYNWSWYLGRSEDGVWELLTWGTG